MPNGRSRRYVSSVSDGTFTFEPCVATCTPAPAAAPTAAPTAAPLPPPVAAPMIVPRSAPPPTYLPVSLFTPRVEVPLVPTAFGLAATAYRWPLIVIDSR